MFFKNARIFCDDFQVFGLEKYMLNDLGIDEKTFKFKLNFRQLLYLRAGYRGISLNKILNNQKLIENPIYIFSGYYKKH